MTHRIGFVIEEELGHATHMANLRDWVARDPDIAPCWIPVRYALANLLDHVPGLPFSVRLSLRARKGVRRQLRAGGLDCLYLHTQALSVAMLDIVSRVPTVISLDATPTNFQAIAPAYDARIASGWIGRAKAARFRKIFARAHRLVAWSEWVRQSLIADYAVAADRIVVLPAGIDLRLWQPRVRPNAADGPLRLLFVGGDFERKGGRLLLQAFRAALWRFCELDIVTRDRSVGAVHGVRIHREMTPNSPELRRLYAQADVFVLPSQGDATPFAIIEAMACGLPVVATGVGALAEVVRDGRTGYLIPPGDAAALVARLTALAADRGGLEAMGLAGRDAVERQFDAAVNYPRLLACLKQAAAAAHAGGVIQAARECP